MAIIWVGPDGNDDSGNGSEVTPWRTLSKAISVAATVSGSTPGDVITVKTGVYRETLSLPANKNLTFYGKGFVFLDGELLRPTIKITANNTFAVFHNFIIRNAKTAPARSWYTPAPTGALIDVNLDTGLYNSKYGFVAGTNYTTLFSQDSVSGGLCFINCTLYFDTFSEANVVCNYRLLSTSVANFKLHLYHCTVKNIHRIVANENQSPVLALYNNESYTPFPHINQTRIFWGNLQGTAANYPHASALLIVSGVPNEPNLFGRVSLSGSMYTELTVRDCILDLPSYQPANPGVTSHYAYATFGNDTTSPPDTLTYVDPATPGLFIGYGPETNPIRGQEIYANTLVASGNSAPGATDAYHDVNLTTTAPNYVSASFPNPNLALDYAGANIASYRGTGSYGSNKGATWYPAFGWDRAPRDLPSVLAFNTAWKELDSSAVWLSDPNYPDGATKGPAFRFDDSVTDHWEVDTVAQPAATSAAVLSPVFKITVRAGSTAYIKRMIREALEDTTPSAGSRKVIDSTLGTATRTAQYRASTTVFTQTSTGLGWTDMAFTDDLSVSFTATFYVQIRIILTLAGQ